MPVEDGQHEGILSRSGSPSFGVTLMGRLALLIAVTALIGLSPLARAQAAQASPQEKKAEGPAGEGRGGYGAGVNANGGGKAATYYPPEGELVISEGIRVVRRPKGPAAVEEYYKRLFSENPRLRLKLTVE